MKTSREQICNKKLCDRRIILNIQKTNATEGVTGENSLKDHHCYAVVQNVKCFTVLWQSKDWNDDDTSHITFITHFPCLSCEKP